MKLYKVPNMICVLSLLCLMACNKDDGPTTILQNDCIKRSLGPNVVSNDIEFVYAMALPRAEGNLVSASVEASVAGADGTYMEHRSFYTNGSGVDVGVTVGSPSVTSGAKTEVTFTVDTCAAALRFYYRIPEEARGGEVSFTFTANADNGETVSYKMGPYAIAGMDMKLNLLATDAANMYVSIADMAVYDAATAAADPGKIDLVYLYRKISGITFEHAFVSPVADAQYLPNVTLPAGVGNSTLIRKVSGLRDRHLANLQYGVYVDDPDFVALDFTGMPNYAVNLKSENGIWVETQDKRYRAYVYVNEINPGTNNTKLPANTARISIKRYAMN